MNVKQIIKKQGWKESKQNSGIYEFEKDIDTIKIYLEDRKDNLKELKNKLWNAYYSRVLICKNSPNDYIIWRNDQSPENPGRILNKEEIDFDERTPPVEYWNKYIAKTSKNTVDKELKKSILTVFQKLNKKHPKRKDDLISVILACTFIRFLEDRDLSGIKTKLIDALKSRKETVALFNKYNKLHNGILFKNDVLSVLSDNSCKILKAFLKNDLFDQKKLFRFDFKHIPIELISNIYQELLTKKLGAKQKKNQGVAYTPPKLANYVTKQVFKQLDKKFNGQDFSNIKIGDLSTGSGIFLVLSFRELLKPERLGAKTFEEMKNILENSFYGMDLDKSAINITIFSLYVELLENEKENKRLSFKNKFPILKNIEKQNMLEYYKKENFFDLVIGNPPWKSRDADSFKKIENRKFSKDIGNKELSQIFVHIGLEKLKNEGILAMILPTATFYNRTSFNFRNSILTSSIIKEFVDFSPIRNCVFEKGVEASVIVVEKKEKNNSSYVMPLRRVINKADYLYFNHVSGNTNNIDSNFLLSRNDSWQIAIRGGNIAVLFIDRLDRDFVSIGKCKKNKKNELVIGTGYQIKKKTKNKFVSKYFSKEFSKELFLCERGEIVKKFTNFKKTGKGHILLNPIFFNECIIVSNSYKYNKGMVSKYLPKKESRAISGDFNIIYAKDKKLLSFLYALLKSRLSEFIISIIGAKTSLIDKERRDPKIQKIDVGKLFIPKDYLKYKSVIRLGEKLIKKESNILPQNKIDKEIEKAYKISNLEKKVIKQWEIMTKRKKISSDNLKNYQRGFECMLGSYNLPKPKKWNSSSQIRNGVEIISFSENNILLQINNDKIKKIKQKINNIVIAKEEMEHEFITDSQCIIMRRKENNYGFLTGLLDAELILSSL